MDCLLANGVFLVSDQTYDELAGKLLDKKFDAYVQTETRKVFITKFWYMAEKVPIKHRVKICRDNKDDKFLELAINGFADYVVTGDKDLLVLNPFAGIPMITGGDFLNCQLGRPCA